MNSRLSVVSTSLILIGLVLLGTSCSVNHDVVQDGFLQKRKYVRKGWFIEAASKRIETAKTTGTTTLELVEKVPPDEGSYLQNLEMELVSLDTTDAALTDLAMGGVLLTASEPQNVPLRSPTPIRHFQGRSMPELYVIPSPDRSVTIRTEYGGLLMVFSSGLVMLLPLAALFTSLLAFHKTTRSEENGSVFVPLVIAMGLLALGALAII